MQVGVLGPLEIDGRPVPFGPRDRVVLSTLALRLGLAIPPETLAEALWGETAPSTWPKIVQGAVVRLRRSLGRDAIESIGGGYRLAVAPGQLDSTAFENSVAQAHAQVAAGDPARALVTFEDALALWRGTPYPDLADWLPGHGESLRLDDLRQTVEEDRVAAGLDCGRAPDLVAPARRLVAEEPQRERRWQLLATALYGAGRQAEALEVLRRATTVLRDEFGLDPGPGLRELQGAVLRQDLAIAPSTGARFRSTECPYPGLLPYGESDMAAYAGRESDVAACERRLAEHPLLVLAGSSGSGKSSLVRAGLAPALRAKGHGVVELAPGPGAVAQLAELERSVPVGTVLVVDQLEEITAAEPPIAGVTALLDGIAAWSRRSPVVIVVRTDRLDDLAASQELAAAAERGIHLLTGMTEDQLRRAIERPAERTGLLLEPSLVEVLLRDAGQEPGSLPLLSHALRATWERRRRDVLTVEAYNAAGGIRGAVAQTAETLYSTLTEQERFALRGLLLRLVVAPSGGPPVSVRISRGLLAERSDVLLLLDRLVAARLLTTDHDSIALAHASLVVAWPRLRQWVDDDATGQQFMAHLQMSADGWVSAGRPDAELYRGARLRRTMDWRQHVRPVLGPDEVEFLDRSAAFEQEESEREQRDSALRRRRAWQRLAAAAAAVLVLVGASVFATSRLGTDVASAKPAVQPGEPWLLVAHRDATDLTNLFVVRPDGSDEHPLMPSRVAPATHVHNAEWSPDGSRVAFETLTAPSNGTGSADVWIVDADGTDPVRVASCASDPCRQFSEPSWSPDGSRLAMVRFDLYPDGACCTSHLEVLDLVTGRRSIVAEVPETPVAASYDVLYSPTWSPDGTQLVVTVERYAIEPPYPFVSSQLAVVPVSGDPGAPLRVITDPGLDAFAPDWHPTDDRIVFSTRNPDVRPTDAESDIFTVKPDGSGLRRLTPAAEGGRDRYLSPSWSSDGQSLSLTIAYVGAGGVIVGMVPGAMPAAGGRPTPVSDSGRGTDVKPRPLAP